MIEYEQVNALFAKYETLQEKKKQLEDDVKQAEQFNNPDQYAKYAKF